jgi:hypothetical protein
MRDPERIRNPRENGRPRIERGTKKRMRGTRENEGYRRE